MSKRNITINIPENYDENIQKLIKAGIFASRSEAVRIAIREYLQRDYQQNLKILNFKTTGEGFENSHD